MKLNEMLVSVMIEGDSEAEALVTELLGNLRLSDLTVTQISSIVAIKNRWFETP